MAVTLGIANYGSTALLTIQRVMLLQ